MRLCTRLWQQQPDERQLARVTTYLSFLEYARCPGRGFHNFLSYPRQWLDAEGCGDCQGQAVRALAEVLASSLPDDYRALAGELIEQVLPALADLRSLRAQAYIVLAWGAPLGVFPRRFGNRYAMIHRPVSGGSSGAHIWLSFSPDPTHWGDHHVLLHARRGAWWDANKIGLSPPPLETPEGWLVLYHGVRDTLGGCLYRLGLALLDLEDPRRVLRRGDEWIFAPEESYERQGDVNGGVSLRLGPESGQRRDPHVLRGRRYLYRVGHDQAFRPA